ncbi:nucleoside kinase [Selenomonas sp.]|uniref:nucleoside kinase n=1 Tax=Selenomonas sp. TaxID=2053611 RepID=UPI0025E1FDBD|nr:nucleoside kinase [Selenomonas sp.]MCI6284954.1 nucleoside kinase [Selenomonas sp.]
MLVEGKTVAAPAAGTTAKELLERVCPELKETAVAGIMDNEVHDLQNPLDGCRSLSFVRLDTQEGWDVYRRSVIFLLITAVHEMEPQAEVKVDFSANGGLFIEVLGLAGGLTASKVAAIEKRMRAIVAEDRPIVKHFLPRTEAVQLFKASKAIEKANLIAALAKETVSVYSCGAYQDYLYGAMLGSTGRLARFALDFFAPGLLLRTPSVTSRGEVPPAKPQPKLSHVLTQAKRWADILHCDYVTDLNRSRRSGQIGDIIRVSEALQEKSIAQIADHIAAKRDDLRLILIAGPSSSGKTSFAQRLRIQLRVNGLEPVAISLDDYFCNRVDTPRTPEGEYDYEALEALDVKLFNEQMVKLLNGEEVELPYYNFVTGEREWGHSAPFSIAENQPIIIEGIHGLNEKLSASIPRKNKYKIYISALTQLNVDAHNRIPTTSARLVRRLVRDYQFRGSSAMKTLKQWPDVRKGEEKHIFPFQEEADVMFNSALIYELGVLKKYAKPLLEAVPPEVPEHIMAKKLLDFCAYFDDITEEDEIPNNSLLREFIGKSVFFK